MTDIVVSYGLLCNDIVTSNLLQLIEKQPHVIRFVISVSFWYTQTVDITPPLNRVLLRFKAWFSCNWYVLQYLCKFQRQKWCRRDATTHLLILRWFSTLRFRYPLVYSNKISLLRRYNDYYYSFKDNIVASDMYANVYASYSVETDVLEMLQHILFHLC